MCEKRKEEKMNINTNYAMNNRPQAAPAFGGLKVVDKPRLHALIAEDLKGLPEKAIKNYWDDFSRFCQKAKKSKLYDVELAGDNRVSVNNGTKNPFNSCSEKTFKDAVDAAKQAIKEVQAVAKANAKENARQGEIGSRLAVAIG
jgi:hypothetical protein